ncbi:M15 family metallopeptidase [Filibacter tadaridae]|uniref:D-alanyl-D-alanine carboxypeptidase n=1 Tax=Filibacter tadaridae TaxID=2483811 RepID=A0A3P5WN48_9BACL|nr:M15 family metallopeptidase [Filibacter tadaridae]VDC19986.1 D-alanyl-D-alanine carboxypeptidase [Filibacter tadaridae]
MKQKNKYSYQKKKKKQGKGLTIGLLISGIVMTGLVIWIGMNDWDLKKSYETVSNAIGLSNTETEKAAIPDIDKKKVDTLTNEQPPLKTDEKVPEKVRESFNPSVNGGYIEGQTLPLEPKYINEILIANKKYPLPETFAPGESKDARVAFEKMAAEAKLSGYTLTAFSTYRSFEYQTTLYEKYVAKDGKEEADRYSARPGYSEHQTGLAFDIGEVNYEQHFASSSFGDTEAGKWIAANAHRFGFIMRYPLGKEAVTGYMYEAWHFRYVGVAVAKEIFNREITLEEYLEI